MYRVGLIILFLIAFLLRSYLLSDNLFFGPEQGIDFNVVKNISIYQDLTLIGAKTDVSGLFHGPIYYYLSVIPFLLSRGDPLFILGFFIFLNSLTVLFIFLLGVELFNKRVAIISALIFTVSYGAIIYSRWLSSHSLSIPLSCLFFLCIIKFIKGKKAYLILASILFGLIGQAEFLNFLFFGVILFILIFIFRNIFFKQNKVFLGLAGLCLIIFSTLNYIIFDLRNQFLMSKSFLKLINGDSGYYISWQKSMIENTLGFLNSFASFITPFYMSISLIILIIGVININYLYHSYKNNILIIIIWLFTPLILLLILRHNVLDQFFVGIIPACILFTSVVLEYIQKKRKFVGMILLIIIIVINIKAWTLNIPENKNIFFQSTQLRLKFSDQKKVIDSIYAEAKGKPFSFQSYTIPYWSQQGWEYLFWYYGKKKYGYLPIDQKAKILFVIVQKDISNQKFQNEWLINTVSKWGVVEKKYIYGDLELLKLLVKS